MSGNLAVMGDFRGIVHIVDISGPTASFVSGFYQHDGDFSNVGHDIFIRNDLAIISDIVSGLAILDLSKPDAPVALSEARSIWPILHSSPLRRLPIPLSTNPSPIFNPRISL